MADVLHRTTKNLKHSVHTPDYPVDDWIINPDMSSVDGVSKEEWVIEGDNVRPMNDSEKTARLPEIQAKHSAAIRFNANQHGRAAFSEQDEFRLKFLYLSATQSGLTNRAAYILQSMVFEGQVQAEVIVRLTAIDVALTEDAVLAVSTDFSSFTIPDVSVMGALQIQD